MGQSTPDSATVTPAVLAGEVAEWCKQRGGWWTVREALAPNTVGLTADEVSQVNTYLEDMPEFTGRWSHAHNEMEWATERDGRVV